MGEGNFANKISNAAEFAKKNASIEAKRLEDKIKSYNSSTKQYGGNNLSSFPQNNSLNTNKQPSKNSGMKEKLQNKVGSAALQSVGIPKEVSDGIMNFAQTDKGKKMMKNINRTQFGPLGGALMNRFMDKFSNNNQTDELPSQVGGVNFTISKKTVKIIAKVSIPVFTVIIFCCLIISATQVYSNAISLGFADSLGLDDGDVLEYINKKGVEKIDDEDFDNLDVYIEDNSINVIRDSKLNNNVIQIASTKYLNRKYNEANLRELEDFYPAIKNSENYDENMVYDFYFKLYNVYVSYRDNYNVYLDLPLIMATLNLQSTDKNVIFSSNLTEEDRKSTVREEHSDYDYYTDWSSYKVTRDNSEHDIELIAQHMVSVRENVTEEPCENELKDGKCYEVDNEKYKEFLKEFLEKKYYITGGGTISSNLGNTTGESSGSNFNSSVCQEDTKFVKYNLNQEQLEQIASLCYYEQGTIKGAAAEASLMANLFEIKGSSYGTGADGLYNYVRNSGWFANSQTNMDKKSASKEIVEAVKSVLVDGKRILPGYIDEHDCISCSNNGKGDITSVTNDGASITKTSRDSYIQFKSKIETVYGATYTFYSFPTNTSDPFGYTSEEKRKEIGEFHYDYDTGKPVGCSTKTSNMAEEMIRIANHEYEIKGGAGDGWKYQKAFGASSGTAWCAIFAWYVSSQTEYNGQKLYPDIIPFRSASTGGYMQLFNESNQSNLKFYYNDSCSTLKGKNGDMKYIPKPGDYIFIDWDATFKDIKYSGPGYGAQDHTAIVEKYENGRIYTIEGNSNNRIQKKDYAINNCIVIGFGSWY